MFTKDFKFSILFDFYGEMLSERQKELIDYYYNDDLSLSEISDITGISRQGIRDAIKKSEVKLSKYEEELGLATRFSAIKDKISDINKTIVDLADKNPEIKNELLNISDTLSSLNI